MPPHTYTRKHLSLGLKDTSTPHTGIPHKDTVSRWERERASKRDAFACMRRHQTSALPPVPVGKLRSPVVTFSSTDGFVCSAAAPVAAGGVPGGVGGVSNEEPAEVREPAMPRGRAVTRVQFRSTVWGGATRWWSSAASTLCGMVYRCSPRHPPHRHGHAVGPTPASAFNSSAPSG
jgi:hypothetical protein